MANVIPKFDIEGGKRKKDVRCLSIGRRGCGKTHLNLHLVSSFLQQPMDRTGREFIVFSPNTSDLEKYKASMDPSLTSSSISFYNRCIESSDLVEENKIFILDDCISSSQVSKDIHGSFFITLPYSIGQIPKVDYLFIFKESSDQNLQLLWNHYVHNIFPSIDQFKETLNQCTVSSYQCMVIDMNTKDIYWYKSP